MLLPVGLPVLACPLVTAGLDAAGLGAVGVTAAVRRDAGLFSETLKAPQGFGHEIHRP
jgi:hypothetical protein